MPPILAIDIDDVLCGYCDAFLPFAKEHGYEIKREDIRGSFVEMGIPAAFFAEFETAETLAHLPVVEGAVEAIDQLARYYTIYAVTSRHIDRIQTTAEWLFGNFEGVNGLYFTKDKGKLCREWNAVALIDDQIRFAEQYDKSIIFAQPWNVAWQGRRGNWTDIVKMLC